MEDVVLSTALILYDRGGHLVQSGACDYNNPGENMVRQNVDKVLHNLVEWLSNKWLCNSGLSG
jgi:hypothetical protein